MTNMLKLKNQCYKYLCETIILAFIYKMEILDICIVVQYLFSQRNRMINGNIRTKYLFITFI